MRNDAKKATYWKRLLEDAHTHFASGSILQRSRIFVASGLSLIGNKQSIWTYSPDTDEKN